MAEGTLMDLLRTAGAISGRDEASGAVIDPRTGGYKTGFWDTLYGGAGSRANMAQHLMEAERRRKLRSITEEADATTTANIASGQKKSIEEEKFIARLLASSDPSERALGEKLQIASQIELTDLNNLKAAKTSPEARQALIDSLEKQGILNKKLIAETETEKASGKLKGAEADYTIAQRDEYLKAAPERRAQARVLLGLTQAQADKIDLEREQSALAHPLGLQYARAQNDALAASTAARKQDTEYDKITGRSIGLTPGRSRLFNLEGGWTDFGQNQALTQGPPNEFGVPGAARVITEQTERVYKSPAEIAAALAARRRTTTAAPRALQNELGVGAFNDLKNLAPGAILSNMPIQGPEYRPGMYNSPPTVPPNAMQRFGDYLKSTARMYVPWASNY